MWKARPVPQVGLHGLLLKKNATAVTCVMLVSPPFPQWDTDGPQTVFFQSQKLAGFKWMKSWQVLNEWKESVSIDFEAGLLLL